MKKIFTRIIILLLSIFSFNNIAFSDSSAEIPAEYKLAIPKGSLDISGVSESYIDSSGVHHKSKDGFLNILGFIQNILLKVVLPVVAVGTSIFIAYELFTAEGDESKLKRAWKAVVYGIVGIMCILLSSLIVNIISNINLG